jgi:hypothetical protein
MSEYIKYINEKVFDTSKLEIYNLYIINKRVDNIKLVFIGLLKGIENDKLVFTIVENSLNDEDLKKIPNEIDNYNNFFIDIDDIETEKVKIKRIDKF